MTARFLLSTDRPLTPTTSPVRVIFTSNIPKLTVSSTTPGPDRQLFRQRMHGEGPYVWHSAFKVKLKSGADEVTVQDPGVFVLNDSTMPVTVQSSINKTFDGSGNPHKFYVSYTATQSSGETPVIANARVIRFLDEEAPTLDLSPITNGTNTFILAEGVHYTDIASKYSLAGQYQHQGEQARL